MARTVRDTNLETRTARLRLDVRGKPYWRVIESGLHLGYRRRVRGGGTWTARRFVGAGKYLETSLGIADDLQDADGFTIHSFRQAQDRARAWWKSEERKAAGLGEERVGLYAISNALDDYVADYIRRGGRDLLNLNSVIKAHIQPALGAVEVSKLTTKKLRDWHSSLSTAARMVRTSKSSNQRQTRPHDENDPEAVRKRRSRANRILTILKAALNHAFAERQVGSDDAWRRVQPFHDVDRPSVHYLTPAECNRLLNTCNPDFRALVRAALLTGARYSELARLAVGDVDLESGTIHIRQTKSGKPRHVPLTEEGVEHFRALTLGKVAKSVVLIRQDGTTWKPSQQARPLLAACGQANISPAISFHGLRDTYASMLAMRGVPLGVIAAALGHADTRVTEKHYAHLSPSFVAETIRTSFPRLSAPEEHNLHSLR